MSELQKTSIVVVAISLWSLGCTPGDESPRASASTTKEASAGECEDLENVLDRLECYVALATDKDDPSVCGQSSHEGVEYQCYAIIAERRGSEELCHVIPAGSPDHQELRDICISDVAEKLLNPLLCERIQTVGLRESCYAKIGRDTGDKTLCEEIRDPGLRSICDGEPVRVQ